MAQLTLYLSDELAADLKRRAKRARKSLSAYVAELAAGKGAKLPRRWPKEVLRTFGSWHGDFPEPPELLPEEREAL